MKDHLIQLVDLSKEYDDDYAVDHINLYIRDGEFLTLLGPSGCGKTTLLRMIAGFETPTSGKVLFDGVDISSLPPYKRKVNTVFQRYALFPHMNVWENIAFGLNVKKRKKDYIEHKVNEMLDLVDLRALSKRKTSQLSGGQQQRVAIARALANEPEILLLDEPLAALDLKLRKDMQIELKRMQQMLGITFVFVTHDQEEALTMSDTIVVMRNGEIQQVGAPQDIYNEPKNAFVADFIGESNIIEGVMKRDYHVEFGGREYECLDKDFASNEAIDVVIRPEDLELVAKGKGKIDGIVTSVVFMGVHYEMQVDVDGEEFLVQSTKMAEEGTVVGLDFEADDIHIMHRMDESIDEDDDEHAATEEELAALEEELEKEHEKEVAEQVMTHENEVEHGFEKE